MEILMKYDVGNRRSSLNSDAKETIPSEIELIKHDSNNFC